MLRKLAESGKLSERLSSPLMKPSVEETETGRILEGKSDAESGENAAGNASEDYEKRLNDLCTGGQLKEAKSILDEMMQNGMSANSSTYITLMEGLIKRQKRLTHAAG